MRAPGASHGSALRGVAGVVRGHAARQPTRHSPHGSRDPTPGTHTDTDCRLTHTNPISTQTHMTCAFSQGFTIAYSCTPAPTQFVQSGPYLSEYPQTRPRAYDLLRTARVYPHTRPRAYAIYFARPVINGSRHHTDIQRERPCSKPLTTQHHHLQPVTRLEPARLGPARARRAASIRASRFLAIGTPLLWSAARPGAPLPLRGGCSYAGCPQRHSRGIVAG